jgi:hypothetical protein
MLERIKSLAAPSFFHECGLYFTRQGAEGALPEHGVLNVPAGPAGESSLTGSDWASPKGF